jgi:periplasmic divalent cation tolerance protein
MMTADGGDTASAVLVCLCACPDRASAELLAHALVDARVAACVNLLPGAVSVYRWEWAIERAEETLLLIKTTRGRLEALQTMVAARHPYTCPELIALETVGGLAGYLHWVASETVVAGRAADAPSIASR